MKGLFIPEITAEMFRSGRLESIEAIMTEGEIYDIDYEPERKKGEWISHPIKGTDSLSIDKDTCSHCGERFYQIAETGVAWNFCPNCGADMKG